MPLGKESLANLATCHVDLQDLIEHVAAGIDRGDLAWAKIRDIKVTCGYRGKVAQDAAVANGFSKAPWPTSKHNTTPSDAVDVVPYPELWSDEVKWRVDHRIGAIPNERFRLLLRDGHERCRALIALWFPNGTSTRQPGQTCPLSSSGR